ncbi:cellobiose phosphorylase [Planctomycetota bacterium]|nr:cellobiose phosphorylase [Planctomycetota bacterium]
MKALATKRARIGGVDGHDLERHASRLASDHAVGARHPKHKLTTLRLDQVPGYLSKLRPYFSSIENASPIAPWFLDNDYLIQRAARQISQDLKASSHARLPSLVGGETRVHSIAGALILVSELQLDESAIDRFVEAYQDESPLRMAELWALPAMLRLCVLEELVGALVRLAPDIEAPRAVSGETPIDLDDCERFVRCLQSIRLIDSIRWKAFYVRSSVVERVLSDDPVDRYRVMDFESADMYRHAVAEIAWGSGVEETEVAKHAVELARDSNAVEERTRHIGYYLIDDGREKLERAFVYTPDHRERMRRWVLRFPTLVYLGGVAATTAAFWAVPLAYLSGLDASWPAWAIGSLLSLVLASALGITVVQWALTRFLPPRVIPKLDLSEGIPKEFESVVAIPTLMGSGKDVRELIRQVEVHHLSNTDPNLRFAILADYHDAKNQHMPGDDELLRQAQTGIALLNEKYGDEDGGPFHVLVRDRQWNPKQGCWMGWERKRGKLEEFNALLTGDSDASSSYTTHFRDLVALRGARFVITLDTDTSLPPGSAARLIGALGHPLNRAQFDAAGRVTAGYTVLQPRTEISPQSANRSLFTRIYAGDTSIDIYSRAVSDVYQDLLGEGSFVGKGIYDPVSFQKSLADRVPVNAILSHDLFEGIHGRVGLCSDIVLYEDYPPHYLAFARRMHRWIRGDWQLLPWLRRSVPSASGKLIPSRLRLIDRWKILDNMRRSMVAPSLLLFLAAAWTILPGNTVLWTLLGLIAPAGHIVAELFTNLAGIRRHAPVTRSLSEALRRQRENLHRWFLFIVFLPHEAVVTAGAIGRTLARTLLTHRRMLDWSTAAQTASAVSDRSPRALVWTEMIGGPLLTFVLFPWILLSRPDALWAAAPLLGLWLASPEIARILSKAVGHQKESLTEDDRELLRSLARRTWLFYETFVGPEDNWLPPDNFQEYPRGEVAHRTSPTNIGMLLMSTLSAYDLGYLGPAGLTFRLKDTLESLARMAHHQGHLFNWYDTRTLEPLEPRYVSTVDSGNLAAGLISLKQGCAEAAATVVLRDVQWEGLLDTVLILEQSVDSASASAETPEKWHPMRRAMDETTSHLRQQNSDLNDWHERLRVLEETHCPNLDGTLMHVLKGSGSTMALELMREMHGSLEHLQNQVRALRREMELLTPWAGLLANLSTQAAAAEPGDQRLAGLLELLSPVPGLGNIGDLTTRARALLKTAGTSLAPRLLWKFEEALAEGPSNAASLQQELLGLGVRAEAEARGMNFSFLYDSSRDLFHIGFDVTTARLDANHYDLLASEARLASFYATAKGDVPWKHWFKLGRPLKNVGRSPVLLSWSATMFEYLMPSIWMQSDEDSLLTHSCKIAVDEQIRYGNERGVPWGISESGFFLFDADKNYQYRAFGVPDLGFKRGLRDDLVIAPYASVLALSLRPAATMRNIRCMMTMGLYGHFGLYESVDFTASRLPAGRGHEVVRSHMAHHQGMILVSIANALLGENTARRFHADSVVQTSEILLHEQVPHGMPTENPHPQFAPLTPAPPEQHKPLMAWRPNVACGVPAAHVLSNGSQSTLHTDSGAGQLRWRGIALTRWSSDPTNEDSGLWIYLRDEETSDLWSTGQNPMRTHATESRIDYHPHKIEHLRRERGIASRMEICVAPADDLELRRVTLTNESMRPRRISATSYAEVALLPLSDVGRHPAFEKLFVVSEQVSDSTLLFQSRNRSPKEPRVVLLHKVVVNNPRARCVGFETDRERFLGRGGSPKRPAVLQQPLDAPEQFGLMNGHTGATLDPILSLQVVVDLPVGGEVTVEFLTIASESKDHALQVASHYRSISAITNLIADAERGATTELTALQLASDELPDLQRLLSQLLFPSSFLRPNHKELAEHMGPKDRLWGHGISGDLPLLLLSVGAPDDSELLIQLIRAQSWWRGRGIAVDLLVITTYSSGYEDEVQGRFTQLLGDLNAEAWLNRRGGVFFARLDQLDSMEDRFLRATASVCLEAKNGDLATQLRSIEAADAPLPEFLPTRHPLESNGDGTPELLAPQDLHHALGLSGFTPDGTEYVIHLEPGTNTPAPWCNVLANADFGCLVSDSGLGYSWAVNSGEHRLTPWRNDPVRDDPAEAVYLRDEETAETWSPTPAPAPDGLAYQVRHGTGYTDFRHNSHGLIQELRVFVAAEAAVKVVRLRMRNCAQRPRRLTATYYAEWTLGVTRDETRKHIVPSADGPTGALLARCDWNPEFTGRVAFLASTGETHGFTTDRAEFLGRNGDLAKPAALSRWGLSGSVQAGRDPCAALQVHIDLGIDQEQDVWFVLGESSDLETALDFIKSFRSPARLESEWDKVRATWEDMLSKVQVKTPGPSMDLLLNRWLPYQVVSSRLHGRTGFYQSSGAFGFRDQLQDVLGLFLTKPDLARKQILNAAAHQFEEGDVLHWWHPPGGRGVRTHCSDDLVWLAYVTAHYVRATGDAAILDERVSFLTAPPLKAGEQDRYGLFATSEETDSLFEHCRRALVKAWTSGPHGLPLIGGGDWNDGMNQVGSAGTGESVWLGWFLCATGREFANLCERREQTRDAEEWRERVAALRDTIEQVAWDGAWYTRAFDDDGQPIGSSTSHDCQIDSISQSWSALSGMGDIERVGEALASASERLISREDRLVRLLDPPFDKGPQDPGYIKAYPPGVRENGGQYTHAAVWLAWAFAKRGDASSAEEIFRLLNPILRAQHPTLAKRYRVEPYVLSADVYSVPPHTGRGGWTWYTGAASWMWRLGVEALLGIQMVDGDIQLSPCIPAEWTGFEATIRSPRGTCSIQVEKPKGISNGAFQLFMDETPLPTGRIPFAAMVGEHHVRATMIETPPGS